jgi:hypothetical protein
VRRPTTEAGNVCGDLQLSSAFVAPELPALTQGESLGGPPSRGNTSREALFPLLFPPASPLTGVNFGAASQNRERRSANIGAVPDTGREAL